MGKAASMRYCRAKALPSALFGRGIPGGDCAWATPMGNALGYEQGPGKWQKAAPNLAIEEQSRAPTWAAELAVANASMSNRLLCSKGPTTCPRLFAKSKLARGEILGLHTPKHRRSSNKAGKKLKAKKTVALVAAQSHRAPRAAPWIPNTPQSQSAPMTQITTWAIGMGPWGWMCLFLTQ